MEVPDAPRSLRSPEIVSARRQLLLDPHIAPLTTYVGKLRKTYPDLEFPDFDPLDGGVAAEVLFLFEKPGPMTSTAGRGSGFISRDNDDPTAKTTFLFMNEARIKRNTTVIWNVIPGWNGTRRITSEELQIGITCIYQLLLLLPNLDTIVLVGKKSQRAKKVIQRAGLKILDSPHPSPLVRASQPDRWSQIPTIWAMAKSK